MKKITYGLVLVLFVVVGAYSYFSPTVTAGDSLFAIKQLGEKIILILSRESNQAEAWARIVGHRLAEFKHLTGNSMDVKIVLIKSASAVEGNSLTIQEQKIAKTLELTKTAFDKSLLMITKISDPAKTKKTVAHLEKLQNKQKSLLESVLNDEKAIHRPITSEIVEKIAVVMEESGARGEAIKKIKEEAEIATLEKRKIWKEKIASSSDFVKKPKIQTEDVQTELKKTKEDLIVWAEAVKEGVGTSTPQVEKMIQRLYERLSKAEQALKDGKLEQTMSLLKLIQALENQAKYFVTEKSWKDKLDKAKQNVKINRIFSDQVAQAMKERSSALKRERLQNLDNSVQTGDMASSTRQFLRTKIKNYQEQIRQQPKQIKKVIENIPSSTRVPEIKVVPYKK
jgi:nicotinamide mononucleotide adenylyltransferase